MNILSQLKLSLPRQYAQGNFDMIFNLQINEYKIDITKYLI